jgi:hypothetical protein
MALRLFAVSDPARSAVRLHLAGMRALAAAGFGAPGVAGTRW